jgi:hypothetical protein
MKAWVVCKQNDGIWGVVDRETIQMLETMPKAYRPKMEINDSMDSHEEAMDLAEGLNAMERIDQA